MFRNEFQTALERDASTTSVALSYQSDDLMEKLKLLGYEKTLLKEMKMKQLHRFYFIRSFNPGEQFFMFISICAWLIRQTGKSFVQPQEFDDPNEIIARIIRYLQEMDIPTDFPTTKLIQGAGAICIYIMDCLATQVIKAMKQNFKTADIKKEETTVIETMENDSEIILEKVEEMNAFASDDSDEEHGTIFGLTASASASTTNIKDSNGVSSRQVKTAKVRERQKEENWIETVDNDGWRIELERVLPSLKVIIKADSRDWRAHLEQMKILRKSIRESGDDTHMQLKKLQSEVGHTLEKIESREKHLNNELHDFIQAFRQVSINLQRLTTELKANDQEKVNLETQIFRVTNDTDNLKTQMEQRGSTMTDGSPLINIKKAIHKIKEEIIDMDVKIALMQHTLANEVIKQSSQYAEFESISLMT